MAARSASLQTVQATAKKLRTKTEQMATDLALRLKHLDGDWLTVLRRVVDDEIQLRQRLAITSTVDEVTQSDVVDPQLIAGSITESE